MPADEKVAYYKDSNDNMLVGALLEDKEVITELDGMLELDSIDYYAIGHNDFAQSLGYPGDSGNDAVQKEMSDIADRIRKAGRRWAGDHMNAIWVQAMLLDSAKAALADK